MPIEVPKEPKVHTTTYQNFKGVDFTNDPSNVWYRRSPDAVNMLPDEAGNPYKRTGWTVEVSSDDITSLYASNTSMTAPSEIDIRKCYYFELSGEDHIFIFTNYGVFFYREGQLYSSKSINPTTISYSANYESLTDAQKVAYTLAYLSYDKDMIEAYDRAFFFEGGGKSAFYIYGGFKIWEYSYDEVAGYKWQTVEPYIPCVNISVDARHESGTSYEAINMLSDYVAETFQNNVYSTVTGHSATGSISGATITVDETLFLAMLPDQGSYVFTYTEADHTWLLSGDQVSISNYGISLGASPANNDTITVAVQSSMRINLPKRVLSITDMKVFASTDTAYDTELILQATKTYTSANYVTLIIPQDVGNSYLEFYQEYLPLVDGEDAIKVIYPRNAVTSTTNTTGEITISVGA